MSDLSRESDADLPPAEPRPITDPVTVYTARDYLEAQILRDTLLDAGIDAFAIDDASQAGTWMFGLISNIHKPTVVVNRSDRDRAAPLVAQFDADVVARERAKHDTLSDSVITVTCDECGATNYFPATRRGGIENCQICRAYLDVE